MTDGTRRLRTQPLPQRATLPPLQPSHQENRCPRVLPGLAAETELKPSQTFVTPSQNTAAEAPTESPALARPRSVWGLGVAARGHWVRGKTTRSVAGSRKPDSPGQVGFGVKSGSEGRVKG
eukprot:3518703-Rhodomonas_salina.3